MEISEFEHAFNLCDEAAGRIADQAYGITRIVAHNHGDITLTTVHEHTPAGAHRLVLLATDDHGQLAAVVATAPDLHTRPSTRILKVRAGELTFHALPTNKWAWSATAGGHTYRLAAATGDELDDADDPLWTTTIDDRRPIDYDALDDAIEHLLNHHHRRAA
ncbi:hypothetical protein [Mycobacterium intracellulare]|uniref:hypothetical protein n=1 Tax=Mycobacterium intracellulare TaxID=1767 RepID=UPI0004510F4E|nr:hypothetical protein [Mycobacterium intracellulare]ETZ38090.1 hypothetical protein L842_6098 [Mycobacterium intracellulare MIN_052511_1280]